MSHSKVFRLVPFSIFYVALLTNLPTTRKRVDFDDDSVTTNFGNMVKGCMHKAEDEKLRRKLGDDSKDNHVYKSIAMMIHLCKHNVGAEQL